MECARMMRRSKDVHKCGMEVHHGKRWQNACLSRISGLTAPPLSLPGSAVVETSFGESVVAGNLGSAAGGGGAATVKGEMSEMLMISSVWSNYSPNAWKAGTRKRGTRTKERGREVT